MAQRDDRNRKKMSRQVKIFPTIEELNRFAAEEFVRLSVESIKEDGKFSVALSGGSTPKKLYALLASDDFRSKIEWQKIHFFFGDERLAAPDDEESNYRMANETLLSKVEIPAENIHRFLTKTYRQSDFTDNYPGCGFGGFQAETNAAAEIAAEMNRRIAAVFKIEPREFPRFDLIFLGMGADGHTASLFPETAALKEVSKIVAENFVPQFDTFRLTFTFPAINRAKNIIFLIAGEDKAKVLKEVLEGKQKKYPAQNINPEDGNLLFLLDEESAKLLSN